MNISETYLLPASRDDVWTALNDPHVLQKCIPGCESLEAEDENHMSATVTTKIGPIKATFRGAVVLSEKVVPESFLISGEGKGGVAGFAKGSARINLTEHPEGTLMHYDVTVAVGGKLAQLGARLITSTSKKLSEQFFASFAAQFATTDA